jgi:orotate phosphoribosyltransferase
MAGRIDLWADRRCRLSPAQSLEELRTDIVRASCIEGDFVLGEGLASAYYFDKYLFETRPAILRRVAGLLAGLVPDQVDRLAAQAPGALALGVALSLESGLPLVILRPDGGDDAPARIEGELYEGETLTLVEDVVVTGSRALRGVEALVAAGARVSHVLAVVDREHGARERLAAHDTVYRHVFTSTDLRIPETP